MATPLRMLKLSQNGSEVPWEGIPIHARLNEPQIITPGEVLTVTTDVFITYEDDPHVMAVVFSDKDLGRRNKVCLLSGCEPIRGNGEIELELCNFNPTPFTSNILNSLMNKCFTLKDGDRVGTLNVFSRHS